MDAFQILRRMKFSKQMTESVKRAVRVRLEAILEQEEIRYARWQSDYAPKCTPTQQRTARRNYGKIITALKVVIWHLSPYFERSSEAPIFFERKKKD